MDIPHITVILNWRNHKNASGCYSIHLRITINRTSKYFKIEIPKKVTPQQWSSADDAWVKNSHPFSYEINNKIQEKKMVIHDLIKRYYNLNKPLTFPVIFRQLKKRGDANSFFKYMEDYISDPPENLHENTLKKYQTCLRHLRQLRDELCFNEIDQLLVQDFYKYLQVKLKLGGPT